MIFLRPIVAFLFAPLNWISDWLLRPRNSILEWRFIYRQYSIKIEATYGDVSRPDQLLICGYILFLARYFYICDDRQIEVVRNYLLKEIKGQFDKKLLGRNLCEASIQTLSERERKAVSMFFPLGPPLEYAEDDEPVHSFAKYSFLVSQHNGQVYSTFHMQVGTPNIVFLPLTVGILYAYVTDKLRDKDKKKILDRAIIDLLEAHNAVDCRSLDGLIKLPFGIITTHLEPPHGH